MLTWDKVTIQAAVLDTRTAGVVRGGKSRFYFEAVSFKNFGKYKCGKGMGTDNSIKAFLHYVFVKTVGTPCKESVHHIAFLENLCVILGIFIPEIKQPWYSAVYKNMPF